MIELTLEMLGEEAPRRYVFWLPPVKIYQPPTTAAPAGGGDINVEVAPPQNVPAQ